MILAFLDRFRRSTGGNIAITFGIAALPLLATVGAGVDYSRISQQRTELQSELDAAVLAGARSTGTEIATASSHFRSQSGVSGATASFAVNGSQVTGTATATIPTTFMAVVGTRSVDITATATALRTQTAGTTTSLPCIFALAPNTSQALLVNSGAKINAPDCEVHVRSTASPAAIFNAGTTLNLKTFCIQGTNIIKNTSSPLPIQTGCAAAADPYAGKLPTPSVGACSNTKQVYDPPAGSGSHTMPAGSVWCDLTFNGSPRIVFQPGLHIIKGRMIINANATIEGTGVTFYFPDTNSEIRFNGGITSKLTAPTSGTYANILMFEPSTSTNTVQYVFNSSVSEEISGLIYLPRRDVTWNSTSTINGSKVQIVTNTIIFNNLDWRLSTNTALNPTTSGSVSVRLIR